MQYIWQSLAWKEWQEHKWKLVSIIAVIVGMVVCILLVGFSRALAESLQVSLYLGGIPLAIFVGLGIAAGEQSRGTIRFLQALPVPMWRIAIVKLGFALLCMLVAVLTAALLFIAARAVLPIVDVGVDVSLPSRTNRGEPFPGHSWTLVTIGIGVLVAMSLVIWSAAWGMNRRDEVSAGAMALGVIVASWVILMFVWFVLLRHSTEPDTARLRALGAGGAPLGFLCIGEIARADATSTWFGWFAFVAVHSALAARFAVNYGRLDDHGIRSPRSAKVDQRIPDYLVQPRRFALTAIAWKQIRESGPIALAGLIAIVAIVACFCLTAWLIEDEAGRGLSNAALVYGQSATIFGFFIALVTGIGVALHDVGTRLNTFWRSRPIQPDLWFAVKFITGLVVVLTTIYVPIGLIVVFGDKRLNDVMNHPAALTIPAAQVAVFAAAVMMTCIVRQAVYSAILSIAVVYVGIFVSQAAWKAARYFGLATEVSETWWEQTNTQLLTGLLGTFAVCTVAAWLAMRNDWGRTSR